MVLLETLVTMRHRHLQTQPANDSEASHAPHQLTPVGFPLRRGSIATCQDGQCDKLAVLSAQGPRPLLMSIRSNNSSQAHRTKDHRTNGRVGPRTNWQRPTCAPHATTDPLATVRVSKSDVVMCNRFRSLDPLVVRLVHTGAARSIP